MKNRRGITRPSAQIMGMGLVIAFLFASTAGIIMLMDGEYNRGVNNGRYYNKGEEGELFTMKDKSMYTYVTITAIFEYNTIIINNDSTFDSYNPYLDIENLMLYSLTEDIASNNEIEQEEIEVIDYACNAIILRTTTNRTGNFVFWLWNSQESDVMKIFKLAKDNAAETSIDITAFVVYDNNRNIKSYILEGIFIPDRT
jgi:hypothetical protein